VHISSTVRDALAPLAWTSPAMSRVWAWIRSGRTTTRFIHSSVPREARLQLYNARATTCTTRTARSVLAMIWIKIENGVLLEIQWS
jgi:hypothetical protein